ncbi:MAG: TraB/GumN family protein [Acetatifactor sp.]
MKKRIVTAILATVMSLSLVSCGNEKESEASATGGVTIESESSEVAEPKEESSEGTEVSSESTEESSDSAAIENPFGETADINDFIDSTEIDPPLWKVTDPESGNTMYLLGTIHLLPEDVSDYPSDLMEIYNNCDSIAVEYDVTALLNDPAAQMEYVYGMIYSDGTNIKDHISEDTYNKAKEYFVSIGAYSDMLDMYTAGYWINQLSTVMYLRLTNVELSGTDTYFISKAQEDGKEIINIEDLSMQTGALNAYSDDYADYNISIMVDSMDDIDSFAESYAELYDMWSKGSGEIGMDIDLDELPDDLLDDYEAYVNILLDERNQHMAQKASEYIKEGKNCLFMVGAAHYSGDNGVDNLLEDMGFTVEKIE